MPIYLLDKNLFSMILFCNNNNKDTGKTIIIDENQIRELNEAAGPSFSLDVIKGMDDYRRICDYCYHQLGNIIGRGSSRYVFQIDDERCIKVARNNKGIGQNNEERMWDKQDYDFIPKIYEFDPDGKWIVCEYVLPAERKDFEHCIGMNWKQFCDFVKTVYSCYAPNNAKCEHSMDYDTMGELIDDYGFFYELYDYMTNRQIPYGDVAYILNWGLAKRNGGAYPVLLDHGMSDSVYLNYYKGK